MSKAFQSLETGDGECSIPNNPDAIDRTPIDPVVLPDPPPTAHDPADVFLPPLDPPGFGCGVAEIMITDDAGVPGGIGVAGVSVVPAAADENDPCFPRYQFDFHVPLVCSNIKFGTRVRKDRIHPDEQPFATVDQGVSKPTESDTCDQATVIEIDLPDIRCEMPTLAIRAQSNLWPGAHTSPVFDITVEPSDTDTPYLDLGVEGIPTPPGGYAKVVNSTVAGASGFMKFAGMSGGYAVYVACSGNGHLMFDPRASNARIPGIEAGRWVISGSDGVPVAWAATLGGPWYPYKAKNRECYELYESTYANLYPKKCPTESLPIPDPFWRVWYAGNESGSGEDVNDTPEPENANLVAPQSPCPERWPQTPLSGDVSAAPGECAVNDPTDHTKDPCKPEWTIDLNLPDATCKDITVCNAGAKFVRDPSTWGGWGDPAADGDWSAGWGGGAWDDTDSGSVLFPDEAGPYGAPAPSVLTRLFAHQRALNSCYPAEDADAPVTQPTDADNPAAPCSGGWDPIRLPGSPDAGKGEDCEDGEAKENKCAQQLRFELSLPFGHPAGFSGGVDGSIVEVDPEDGIALRITPVRTVYKFGMVRGVRYGSATTIPYDTGC